MLHCWKKGDCGNLPLVVWFWIFVFANTTFAKTGCPYSVASGLPLATGPLGVDLGQDTTLCAGDSLLLNAFHPGLPPNVDYTWSTGDSVPAIWVSTSGTYFVTVTNSSGNLTDIDSILVNFLALPSLNLGYDSLICPGDSILLSAPTGPWNLLWSTGDSGSTTFANQNGSYWVQAQNGNCNIGDTVYFAPALQPFVALGVDTSWCGALHPRTLQANPSNQSGWTYIWSDGSTGSDFNVSVPGTYAVTVTSVHNCSVSDSITISYGTEPQIDIAGLDSVYCLSDPDVSLLGSPPGGLFSGSGINGNFFSPSTAGEGRHEVKYTYTDSVGCVWPGKTQTRVVTPPSPANAGSDQSLETFTERIQLTGSIPDSASQGTWTLISGEASLSDPSNPMCILSQLGSSTYTLNWQITSAHCPATNDEVNITVGSFVIPNGFSPNGDGVNDRFVIHGLENLQSARFQVFNRWGSLVFESQPYRNTWNGESEGGPLPDDTYFYTLNLGEKGAYNGTIRLKR